MVAGVAAVSMAEAVVLAVVAASMAVVASAAVAAFTAEALRVLQAEELIAEAAIAGPRVLRLIAAATECMVAEDPMGRTPAAEDTALTVEAARMVALAARPVMEDPGPHRRARILGVPESPTDSGMGLAILQEAVQLHPAAQ